MGLIVPFSLDKLKRGCQAHTCSHVFGATAKTALLATTQHQRSKLNAAAYV